MGGYSQKWTNEVYVLDTVKLIWSLIQPATTTVEDRLHTGGMSTLPAPREGHSIHYSDLSGCIMLYGGYSWPSGLNDFYALYISDLDSIISSPRESLPFILNADSSMSEDNLNGLLTSPKSLFLSSFESTSSSPRITSPYSLSPVDSPSNKKR